MIMVAIEIVFGDSSPWNGDAIAIYLSTAKSSNIPADAVVVMGPNAGRTLQPTYPKCHFTYLVIVKYTKRRGLNMEAKKSITAK